MLIKIFLTSTVLFLFSLPFCKLFKDEIGDCAIVIIPFVLLFLTTLITGAMLALRAIWGW